MAPRLFFAALLLSIAAGCSVSDLRFSADGWKTLSEVEGTQPFKIGRKSTQLLPYSVRISKIKSLSGQVPASLFDELERRQFELGGFDYSKGVGQELSWSETRMTVWAKALQPLCTSQELKNKYPWPASAEKFLKAAYGRTLGPDDLSFIEDVKKTQNASASERFEIFCTTTLSSMEFLSL